MNKFIALCLLLLTAGCGFWSGAKPIVRTVDDIARDMCVKFFSERNSLSLEDAARAYCKKREDWARWIDPILAAQQEGANAMIQDLAPPAAPQCPEAPPSPAQGGVSEPEPSKDSPAKETAPQAAPAPAKE